MAESIEEAGAALSVRLSKVKGEGEKVNDIFAHGRVKDCKEHVIFFGGDVQDYPENMELHRDNKRYKMWNTEATACILHRKFPQSLVFVIKPTRMHFRTFAVYSNFVETNDFGNPTHNCDYGAVKHLSSLYSSAVDEIYRDQEKDKTGDLPIRLVGFSKGCVVLNQITFELPVIDSEPSLQKLIKKIEAFYWLDGGHAGGPENTWVTEEAPLRHLAGLEAEIHIHLTPYQMRDPLRKWIGQQQSKFHKKLKKFNAKVTATDHFDIEPACVENHFRVLEAF